MFISCVFLCVHQDISPCHCVPEETQHKCYAVICTTNAYISTCYIQDAFLDLLQAKFYGVISIETLRDSFNLE